MNDQDKKNLYAALAAPFPAEAIERTDRKTTGKGYSTTGIKAQFVVNRLNEIMGLGGFRIEHKMIVRPSTNARGRSVYEAACELLLQLGEWVNGTFVPIAEARAVGGHASVVESDALKGALTNSLKRAAAFLGCGKQAYEGTIDDDNVASAFADDSVTHHEQRPTPQRTTPAAANIGGDRNRLSAKQLAALWAIARKLDIDTVAFRNRVKQKFGCTLEFLDRNSASSLISELSAKLGDGQVTGDNALHRDEAA